MFKLLYRGLLDALFPFICTGCKAYGTPLCLHCISSCIDVHVLNGDSNTEVSQLLTLGAYSNPLLQRAVRQLKFHGIKNMAQPLGQALAAALHEYAQASKQNELPILIPVPLHAARLKERGYNQAEMLAKSVSSALGWPVNTDVLTRDITAYRQADLAYEDRWKHVEGIFHLTAGSTEQLKGKDIWVVDDVVTTGATALSAVNTLRQAQPASISLCAVARGL